MERKVQEIKLTHGGKRPGSGAKKKEETESTGFRINREALNICRAAYGRTLNKQVNDFIKRLAKKAGKGSSKPNVICCGFFHEAPQSDIDSLIANKGTWGDIMERYKQPDWCSYPNALEGQMGCWSLTDLSPDGLRNKISESFCQSCPEFKKLGSHSI